VELKKHHDKAMSKQTLQTKEITQNAFELQTTVAEHKSEIDSLLSDQTKKRNELKQLKDRFLESNETSRKFQQKIDKQQQEIASLNDEITRLNGVDDDLTRSRQQIVNLSEEATAKTSEVEEFKAQLSNQKAQRNELEVRVCHEERSDAMQRCNINQLT